MLTNSQNKVASYISVVSRVSSLLLGACNELILQGAEYWCLHASQIGVGRLCRHNFEHNRCV